MHQRPSPRDGRNGIRSGTPIARLVLLLSFGHFLAFVDRAKVAGAMPAIRHELPMSDTAASWVIGTAFALGYGVTILVLAFIALDRSAKRSWRLPVGIAVGAAASLATGLVHTLPQLIGARVALGVGQALFIPAALTALANSAGAPGERASALATFTAGSSLGRSGGLLIIGLLLSLVAWAGGGPGSWRWAFLLTALPNLALLVWCAGRPATVTGAVPVARSDRVVPRRAQLSYLLLACAPVILAQAVIGWLPTLFVRDRGLSPGAAATWIGLVTLVAGPGGQLLGGWLMRWAVGWHRLLPLVVVAAMAATLPSLALVAWGGAFAATVGVLLLNLALGIAAFTALFGWQFLLPGHERLTGNGVFLVLITTLGVGLGPLTTGLLTDQGTTLRTALLLTAFGCVVLASAAILFAQPAYAKHWRA